MMKRISYILLLICTVLRLSAQVNPEVKPSTLVFHVFYDDFKTAHEIHINGLGNTLRNNLLTNISDMQMGFGFDYVKGISKNIDFIASADGSSIDYLFKNNTYNGSNQFSLDVNASLNIKLLSDRHTIAPYLSTGAGFSLYKSEKGIYIPVGLGLQFNVFHQAFVFTNVLYKREMISDLGNHMEYSIGIGASIGKKKTASPPVLPPVIPVKITKPDTTPVVAKIPVKNLVITVTDEQTGLPLPAVKVTVNGQGGKLDAFTDANGRVTFNNVQADDYTVSGTLNGISTTNQQLSKKGFDIPGQEININITHNDPRFTLNGTVSNKSTNKPEGNVSVSVINTTQNSSVSAQSQAVDGTFNMQLEAGSDFTVSGKKAGYISNIEKISTKGLNRSTTLHVNLELGIEEALPDKTITLSNIYYDTGSAKIRPTASSDLEKLVKFLKDNPDLKIEIASNTDSRGSAKRNLILSRARAQAVVNYLLKNGIAKNRLIPKGYGATRLVNGCKPGVKCTEAQHEQNRRTEFKVVNN